MFFVGEFMEQEDFGVAQNYRPSTPKMDETILEMMRSVVPNWYLLSRLVKTA